MTEWCFERSRIAASGFRDDGGKGSCEDPVQIPARQTLAAINPLAKNPEAHAVDAFDAVVIADLFGVTISAPPFGRDALRAISAKDTMHYLSPAE